MRYVRGDSGMSDEIYIDGKSWRKFVSAPKTDTPKLWRDMTPEEKGALLLAQHEGNIIQSFAAGNWGHRGHGGFGNNIAYRVKPERTVDVVMLHGRKYVTRTYPDGVWDFDRNERQGDDTHLITFNVIDGKPDCDSIRMERL